MLVDGRFISVKVNDSQLRERNRALFILCEMSNFLSTSLDLQQILDGALSKVLEFFDFSAGRIYLMDKSGEFLKLAACRGVEASGLETVRLDEGFSGKAASSRSFLAQRTSDLKDKRRAELLMRKGLKIIVCVPLIARDEVLGVMNLAAAEDIELDQAKIDLLISIGNQIAIAANDIRLYEEINAKIKELKAQKEAIEFFAYSISHDLKSPAIGIYGLTRRLHRQCRDGLDDKGREYCDQILKAAGQIVGMVDKINAYIIAKEAPLHFETVSMDEVTEIVRNEFSEVLRERGVKWLEPGNHPTIVADKISLIRVMRNFVDNALKHGGEGLTEIRIEHRDEPDFHVISVSDDGITLKKEDSERLFQLFHRHEQSRGVEGAGLGLAIVKEIAKRHGGQVWVDPESTQGTTFCISIAKALRPAATD